MVGRPRADAFGMHAVGANRRQPLSEDMAETKCRRKIGGKLDREA